MGRHAELTDAAWVERLARFGGLIGVGLVTLIGVVLLLGGRPSRSPDQIASQATREVVGDARFAQLGETVRLQGWEVTLLDFGRYDRFSSGPAPASDARGGLVLAELRIKNIQSRAADFSRNDFALQSGDGRRFAPAAETATVERGLVDAETVPPGETAEKRLVFDLPPDARNLLFEALEIEFAVPDLGE
jgi:hypothetical protein